jgi:GTP-binding protein EngB required for normal cell division
MIGFRSRGRDGDLPARLEALASAVDLADGRLDEEAVAFARHVVDKAENRLRHGTTHTLVAVLGATGSGKSSVVNLVAGSAVATTGVRRPTTSSTLACVWGPDDAGPLLDWLEVASRHRIGPDGDGGGGHDGADLDGLVLLDVPDHDSVAEAHREEMERIAEHADVLVWVTDPEKYADKALHDYLARLAGHGAVMTLVLNKADLLVGPDVEACRTDLSRLLNEAGLDRTPVLTLSARTGQGRDELRKALGEAVAGKRAAVERLAADTTLAAGELAGALGDRRGPTEVPRRVADRLAADLVEAAGVDAVGEAVAAGHRRDGARRTGWPFTRWLRRLRPHPLGRLHLDRGSTGRASRPEPSGVQRARTKGALRDVAAAVGDDLPDPWPAHIRTSATPAEDTLADRIDVAVAEAVRAGRSRDPHWWAAVGVVQWILAAAAVAGALWLGLLALAAYLRIPEPPYPEPRGIPLPTALLLGGILLGLVVAAVAGRLTRLGARREARAVRRRAERSVAEVAAELVIEPVETELRRLDQLHDLLDRAAGR